MHQGREISRWYKEPAFCTKFFANFHFFVFFPSSCRNSTKPHHFTMCQYSAKQCSGIIYYISQQSHVTHQFGLWNVVVIHIIIIVTHETIDGQVPVHNNIWSSLWFRTAILSSPFYNIMVPTFLSTGDDVTVPSSSILSKPLQHMQVTIGCSPHARFSITMHALIPSPL
jgi:hypothetical protein